jgi:hypothetical protein
MYISNGNPRRGTRAAMKQVNLDQSKSARILSVHMLIALRICETRTALVHRDRNHKTPKSWKIGFYLLRSPLFELATARTTETILIVLSSNDVFPSEEVFLKGLVDVHWKLWTWLSKARLWTHFGANATTVSSGLKLTYKVC